MPRDGDTMSGPDPQVHDQVDGLPGTGDVVATADELRVDVVDVDGLPASRRISAARSRT